MRKLRKKVNKLQQGGVIIDMSPFLQTPANLASGKPNQPTPTGVKSTDKEDDEPDTGFKNKDLSGKVFLSDLTVYNAEKAQLERELKEGVAKYGTGVLQTPEYISKMNALGNSQVALVEMVNNKERADADLALLKENKGHSEYATNSDGNVWVMAGSGDRTIYQPVSMFEALRLKDAGKVTILKANDVWRLRDQDVNLANDDRIGASLGTTVGKEKVLDDVVALGKELGKSTNKEEYEYLSNMSKQGVESLEPTDLIGSITESSNNSNVTEGSYRQFANNIMTQLGSGVNTLRNMAIERVYSSQYDEFDKDDEGNLTEQGSKDMSAAVAYTMQDIVIRNVMPYQNSTHEYSRKQSAFDVDKEYGGSGSKGATDSKLTNFIFNDVTPVKEMPFTEGHYGSPLSGKDVSKALTTQIDEKGHKGFASLADIPDFNVLTNAIYARTGEQINPSQIVIGHEDKMAVADSMPVVNGKPDFVMASKLAKLEKRLLDMGKKDEYIAQVKNLIGTRNITFQPYIVFEGISDNDYGRGTRVREDKRSALNEAVDKLNIDSDIAEGWFENSYENIFYSPMNATYLSTLAHEGKLNIPKSKTMLTKDNQIISGISSMTVDQFLAYRLNNTKADDLIAANQVKK